MLHDLGDGGVGLRVRARIGSTVKPSNWRTSPCLPVTVRICVAGTAWLRSFSVVTGAPTTSAPVRTAIEAASAMWSK
jgi:hypothetical protein